MELPADYLRRGVELGWAVAGYGNQGDTVDIGLVVIEPVHHPQPRLRRHDPRPGTNVAWFPDATGLADPAMDSARSSPRPPTSRAHSPLAPSSTGTPESKRPATPGRRQLLIDLPAVAERPGRERTPRAPSRRRTTHPFLKWGHLLRFDPTRWRTGSTRPVDAPRVVRERACFGQRRGTFVQQRVAKDGATGGYESGF